MKKVLFQIIFLNEENNSSLLQKVRKTFIWIQLKQRDVDILRK